MVFPTAAAAQTVSSGAAQAARSDDQPNENDIVVTAQKREQAAQDVGISLTVLDGSDLREQGIVAAPDLAKLTPGLSVAGAFAGQTATFAIRGVTQQDFNAQAEGPVALYVDEGYFAANNTAGVGLFDVERVEVLKGPQGTLFGRNATGGLISITTRRPTDKLQADVDLSYGSYNDVRLEAGIGGPLGANAQARVAAVFERNDGWLRNISPTGDDLGGKRTASVRAHLALQPAADLRLLLTGYFSDVRQSWGPYTILSTRSVLNNGVPDAVVVNAPTTFGEPASDFEGLRINANDARSRGGFSRIAGGTFKAQLDLGGTDLTAITDYKVLRDRQLIDVDSTAARFINSINSSRVANGSQELRLFRDFGGASLTGGLYYLNIDARGTQLSQLFGLGGVQIATPLRLKTDSYSGFAQGELRLGSGLSLIGGLRVTRENKRYRYDAQVSALNGTLIANGRSYRDRSGNWLYSWKGQLEYRPARRTLLYAGYNRGTKAGNFNAPFAGSAIPADPDIPYKAERLDAFEIGGKTELADRLLTLNGSAFYYDYHDYQAYKFVNLSTVITNNPARIYGAELSVGLRPTSGLDLNLGASYIDAIVRDVQVSNALGSAVRDRRPPYTSKFQLVGNARYAADLAGGTAAVQVDVQYRSPFYFSVTNFASTRARAYTLVNGRVSWTTPDERFEAAVFARNLFDRRYATVGIDVSDFGGFTEVAPGEPRWIGASINYRYR